jgi:hypothetical protein
VVVWLSRPVQTRGGGHAENTKAFVACAQDEQVGRCGGQYSDASGRGTCSKSRSRPGQSHRITRPSSRPPPTAPTCSHLRRPSARKRKRAAAAWDCGSRCCLAASVRWLTRQSARSCPGGQPVPSRADVHRTPYLGAFAAHSVQRHDRDRQELGQLRSGGGGVLRRLHSRTHAGEARRACGWGPA